MSMLTLTTLPMAPVASMAMGTVVDTMFTVVEETGTTVLGSCVVTPSCERPSTSMVKVPDCTPEVQSKVMK